MAELAAKLDISAADGQRIVNEAANWDGTPYGMSGAKSVRGVAGDCSGSTYEIYRAAGFPYPYQTSGSFLVYAKTSGQFRALAAGEQPQDGDILSWPGHIAIYCTFSSDPAHAVTVATSAKTGASFVQNNDMWSAHNPGGPPYGPASSRVFKRDPPTIFRYQLASPATPPA
jgi:hypothetical protein